MHTYHAVNGQTVTQADANACASEGHKTHTVDGVDTGVCPRCGEVKAEADTAEVAEYAYSIVPVALVRQGRLGFEVRKMNARTGALIDCLCTWRTMEEAEAHAASLPIR